MPIPWLAIGIGASAAAGAGLGLWSTAAEEEKARDQLWHQKDMAWQQYLLGQEYSEKQFALERREAVSQLGLQERRLGEGLDRSVAQMNAGLLGQAYAAQDAQIQTASAIGASVAAEGASGTRGSSGGGLMRAYQQQSLDRSLAQQDQQNAVGLAGLAAEASNARQDLTRERSSWTAGGYRYESKQAQDAYNESIAKLGQTDFDWRLEQAKAGPTDWLLGALGGAVSGFNTATSVHGWLQSLGAANAENKAKADKAKAAEKANGFDGVGGQGGRDYAPSSATLDWRIQ
jgi:hypothetical protein